MLAFDLAHNNPARLKHCVVCKYVMLFEPVAVNVNFTPVSMCQCVNVVRSVFCHPHVSFLAKPLFTTVNLVGPVTVYNVKSVNSPHHIQRVFPSMHCTTSIHRKFSYQRHENVTSFPLPSSNLLPSPVIKSHLSPLTSKLNLSPRPSLPPGTSSPPNFQHVSSSIKICLFLMTLFNMILPNQPTQYILVINILVDIILLFLVYLKFSSNISGTLIHYIKQYNNFLKLSFDCFITCIVFNTTCYIEMDSFSATSKAVILVAIYIVLCLQNKTFPDKVLKHSGSGNCCGKCTKNLAALLRFFFSNTYLTYFSGTMLLSTIIKHAKFILSHFFSIFKYRIFMFFLLMYLHPIFYKNNSSVSRNLLPRHVNKHWKQSIYKTNILNNFKTLLTIFNSSVDYNFVFNHSFKFYATFDDNLVLPDTF